MKNIIVFVLLIITLLTAFSGCTSDTEEPGINLSSEAAILSYASDYIIGEAIIDSVNKKIYVTVKPMDLANFNPVITISDKAVITPPDSIEDGTESIYRITAENGIIAEWKVTITVQYGITFTMDENTVTLTGGYENSVDPINDATLGSGIPALSIVRTYSTGVALEQIYDQGTETLPPDPAYDFCNFTCTGISTGSYSGEFTFSDYSEETIIEFELMFTITEFGDAGDNFRATFSGAETDPGTIVLSEGYAKLIITE